MNNLCKPNCLKYPMCVSRQQVKCNELFYWFLEQRNKSSDQDTWNHINIFLPNVIDISNINTKSQTWGHFTNVNARILYNHGPR